MKNKNVIPKLTEADKREAYSNFPNYLFFKTIKPGVRECHCTACGRNFKGGVNFPRRTMSAKDFIADKAKHLDKINCPECGASVTVINEKIQLNKNNPRIDISSPTIFFRAINPDDIWLLGYFVERTYSGDGEKRIDEQFLTNAYHLTPGKSTIFKRSHSPYFGWTEELYEEESFKMPFQWDCGLSHVSYNYSFIYCGNLKLNDTFLKYSGFEHYRKSNEIQYWCNYCNHPQFEMLAKIGLHQIIDRVNNGDELRMYLDWNAKKPWELVKLDKQVYQEWGKSGAEISALKFYQRLKGNSVKEMRMCGEICKKYYLNGKQIVKMAANIKKAKGNKDKILKDLIHIASLREYIGLTDATFIIRKAVDYKREVKDIINYCERIAARKAKKSRIWSSLKCYEVIDMWIDYVNMGDSRENFNPFPADLKAAHDALLYAKKSKDAQKLKDKIKREEKTLFRSLSQKYKKANKNCKALKEKYAYDNGKLAFVTPDNMADIYIDGKILNQCTARSDCSGNYWRYFDRINRGETYIGFVRKSASKGTPYFTIEFEPGGTVRQKRAENDSQPALETKEVTAFLVEWQNAIRDRLTTKDRAAANKSKIERIAEFTELRESGKKINYGNLAGTLLIDAFEKDLMEIEIEAETA